MKRILAILARLLLLFLSIVRASPALAVQPDDVVGRWKTFRDGRHHGTVEIYRTSQNTYEGKIVWGEHPGRLDEKNPDPALRNRLLVGTVFLREFRYQDENDWSGGRIYDPDSGHEYRSYMKLEDGGKDMNTLRLRGYVGISLLGRTEKWTRASGADLN
ncbi:MAG: DUF2147 domain-containing protein [Chlorobiaceae bacterium]|nr:DUF2147 domain-containing protein [Chlorobiaceae bacterium]